MGDLAPTIVNVVHCVAGANSELPIAITQANLNGISKQALLRLFNIVYDTAAIAARESNGKICLSTLNNIINALESGKSIN